MNTEHQGGCCCRYKVIRTQLTLVTIDFGKIREEFTQTLVNFRGQQIIGREE